MAPDGEQFALPLGQRLGVQSFHAAHDEPGGGVERLLLAGERRELNLGYLRVGDPVFLLLVP
ncbi:hypothetical protein, partial [Streptomyces antimycoticus]|uniref:hypothetical protein n=1 Tax=Streptomyces antimycoticus TaxID=68175 RepID=UPI001F3988BE